MRDKVYSCRTPIIVMRYGVVRSRGTTRVATKTHAWSLALPTRQNRWNCARIHGVLDSTQHIPAHVVTMAIMRGLFVLVLVSLFSSSASVSPNLRRYLQNFNTSGLTGGEGTAQTCAQIANMMSSGSMLYVFICSRIF